MIRLCDIEEALTTLIKSHTAQEAAAEKTLVKGDATYIVSAEEGQCTLIAGGKQIERTVSITVSCYIPKERAGEGHQMIHKLFDCFFPYFTLCRRSFSPQNCSISREKGLFTLYMEIFFCDTFDATDSPLNYMGSMNMNFSIG